MKAILWYFTILEIKQEKNDAIISSPVFNK